MATPVGAARVHHVPVARPRALVVLGHGAGRGVDTADLLGLARDLPTHRVSVALVDQPWVVAGRRIAVAPPVLDEAWLAVLDVLRPLLGIGRRVPLVTGGRSAGARVACRTAGPTGARAVLLLAYPLVPPVARSDDARRAAALARRRPELRTPSGLGIATVVAQGERDLFGSAVEVRTALSRARGSHVVAVPDADHALRTRSGGPDPALVLLAAALRAVARARGE